MKTRACSPWILDEVSAYLIGVWFCTAYFNTFGITNGIIQEVQNLGDVSPEKPQLHVA